MSKQQGHVGGRQVGGPTHELRQHVGDRIEAILRVETRCLALVLLRDLGRTAPKQHISPKPNVEGKGTLFS